MVKHNLPEFRAYLERLKAKTAGAAELGSVVTGGIIADYVVLNCPKDTNRLYNGYVDAFNRAGLGPYFKLALTESRFAKEYRDRLKRQVRWYGTLIAQAERSGRSVSRKRVYGLDTLKLDTRRVVRKRWVASEIGPSKTFTRLQHKYQRAKEELAKFEGTGQANPAIVFNAFGAGKSSRLVTVRDKVYGGDGRQVISEGRIGLRFENLEPNATMVERTGKRAGVVLRAMARAEARTAPPAEKMADFLGAVG